MYRIHQIKLKVGESTDLLPLKIIKKIGNRDLMIGDWKIVRESIDARDKSSIWLVYSVDFEAVYKSNPKKRARLAANPKLKLEIAPDTTYALPVYEGGGEMTGRELRHRPVIVGFGPAGMFAALILARAGLKPLVLERGQDVDQRTAAVETFWQTGKLNVQSNVQFGEGGAGTFSDGKLTTGIKDPRIAKVLEELTAAGASEDILYKQKPHVGTDVLRTVVKNIRETIIKLGGEVRFNTYVEDLQVEDGHVAGVIVRDVTEESTGTEGLGLGPAATGRIPAEAVVLAIGHSSRDTFRWLHEKGITMSQKPFSMGVRIEHPQDMVDTAQYGAPGRALGLPPADYKLNHRCENGRGVYTFCMCPGGEVVIASSQEGGVVTNGMSYHARNSGTANSALLCDVRTEDFGSDDVLAGVIFQEKYERLAFDHGGRNYKAPQSTWGQLRDGQAPDVEACLPDFVVSSMREAMPHLGRKLKGFDREDAVVTAVEARSSSPVRFARDEHYEGQMENGLLRGFFPCGEGAGYAGGITSAAVDGIRIAEAIIRGWKPNF